MASQMNASVIDQSPRNLVAASAENRDCLALLVAYLDLVDARAAPAPALGGDRAQLVALARRQQELDGCAGGDGVVTVRVTGECERAVGERKDEPTVADPVAVDH